LIDGRSNLALFAAHHFVHLARFARIKGHSRPASPVQTSHCQKFDNLLSLNAPPNMDRP